MKLFKNLIRTQSGSAWIRWVSPIMTLSILGLASSSLGYYTAQNQTRIVHDKVSNLPTNDLKSVPKVKKLPKVSPTLRDDTASLIAVGSSRRRNKAVSVLYTSDLKAYLSPDNLRCVGNGECLSIPKDIEFFVEYEGPEWLKIVDCQKSNLCRRFKDYYIPSKLYVCDFSNCLFTIARYEDIQKNRYLLSLVENNVKDKVLPLYNARGVGW